jgi:hypothetical protein
MHTPDQSTAYEIWAVEAPQCKNSNGEAERFGYLMPISLQNGCATTLDKTQSVQLIPGTITKITKEIIIEVENSTTLDLLFMIDKVIETEEKDAGKEKEEEEEKDKEKYKEKEKEQGKEKPKYTREAAYSISFLLS